MTIVDRSFTRHSDVTVFFSDSFKSASFTNILFKVSYNSLSVL
jgi:hypothetical protein